MLTLLGTRSLSQIAIQAVVIATLGELDDEALGKGSLRELV
jgi:hypothetical protein